MPVKLVFSGTKATIKIIGSIATLLGSVRTKDLQPMKGTKNPAHLQTKLPKYLARKGR